MDITRKAIAAAEVRGWQKNAREAAAAAQQSVHSYSALAIAAPWARDTYCTIITAYEKALFWQDMCDDAASVDTAKERAEKVWRFADECADILEAARKRFAQEKKAA